MSNGQALPRVRTLAIGGTRKSPTRCRERVRWKVFSLIRSLPSSLSADSFPSLVRAIPRQYVAVRLLGDVHAGRTA